MADPSGDRSTRLLRAALPAGLLLLGIWVLFVAYFIIRDEFHPRPLMVVLLISSLFSFLGAIVTGWHARRYEPPNLH